MVVIFTSQLLSGMSKDIICSYKDQESTSTRLPLCVEWVHLRRRWGSALPQVHRTQTAYSTCGIKVRVLVIPSLTLQLSSTSYFRIWLQFLDVSGKGTCRGHCDDSSLTVQEHHKFHVYMNKILFYVMTRKMG